MEESAIHEMGTAPDKNDYTVMQRSIFQIFHHLCKIQKTFSKSTRMFDQKSSSSDLLSTETFPMIPSSNENVHNEISDQGNNPWEDEELYSMSSTVEYEDMEEMCTCISENSAVAKKTNEKQRRRKGKKNQSKLGLETLEFIESLSRTSDTKKSKTKRPKRRKKHNSILDMEMLELLESISKTSEHKTHRQRKGKHKQTQMTDTNSSTRVTDKPGEIEGNRNKTKCKRKARLPYSMIQRLQDRNRSIRKLECSRSRKSVSLKNVRRKTSSKSFGSLSISISVRTLYGRCSETIKNGQKWTRSLPPILSTNLIKTLKLDTFVASRCGMPLSNLSLTDVRRTISKKANNRMRNKNQICKNEKQTKEEGSANTDENNPKKCLGKRKNAQKILQDILLLFIVRVTRRVIEREWLIYCILLSILMERTTAMFCPDSLTTVSSIPSCPSNEKDWRSAAEKMKCENQTQRCCPPEEYKYHCLINVFQNMTLELCAPRVRLNYCAQYDYHGARIQNNFNANCTNTSTDCQRFYDSNKGYEMPNCLKLTSDEDEVLKKSDENRPKKSGSADGVTVGIVIGITLITLVVISSIILWRKGVSRQDVIVCELMKLRGRREIPVSQYGDDVICIS